MNQLPEAKRIQILSCLLEGMSVRGTGRVTGTSKGAVLRLIAEIGPACERFHHRFVQDVPAKRLEMDELHQFVLGKSRCLPPELRDSPDHGTIWTWLAISEARLIVSYLVGRRDLDACNRFVADVALSRRFISAYLLCRRDRVCRRDGAIFRHDNDLRRPAEQHYPLSPHSRYLRLTFALLPPTLRFEA